jgi:hydrogenase maturation protease
VSPANTRVVVGLGNLLAGDEGIGVRLVERLAADYVCANLELIDLGTSLFSLIHVLENKTAAVILDCALMGEKPGTLRRFILEEARSKKQLRHLSLHEGDVFTFIDLALSAGTPRMNIVLFGIEPAQMEIGRGLSAELERRMDEYLAAIAAEIGVPKKARTDA